MNILHIAPLTKPLPPQGYGGAERVVHWLAKALAELGHKVYVATLPGKDQTLPYELIELPLRPVGEKYEKQDYVKACKFLGEHLPRDLDIIHGHSAGNIYHTREIGSGACEIRKYSLLPLLITIHGLNERLPQDKSIEVCFISRSQMQKYGYSQRIIHNPIDSSEYIFSEEKEDFLLWMSKLSWKEKGLDIAIEVASKGKYDLFVAGPGLNRGIEKKLKGRIKYIGELSGAVKANYLARARAFLHTAVWEEPFGIAVVEAMISGTPVLAFNLGAMPEIIDSGHTGFICRDAEEMRQAIGRIGSLSPRDCRNWAMGNFESHEIARQYLNLYGDIIKAR